jgi:hypothetical protein
LPAGHVPVAVIADVSAVPADFFIAEFALLSAGAVAGVLVELVALDFLDELLQWGATFVPFVFVWPSTAVWPAGQFRVDAVCAGTLTTQSANANMFTNINDTIRLIVAPRKSVAARKRTGVSIFAVCLREALTIPMATKENERLTLA